jgi:hypothetical protein
MTPVLLVIALLFILAALIALVVTDTTRLEN